MATISDASQEHFFYYIRSCVLNVPLQIKIGTLEGYRGERDVKALLSDPMLQFSGQYQSFQDKSDLYVELQVFDDGKAISLPSQTAHKPFTNRWSWNEWVTVPIMFKDIPRTAQLAITIYDIYGPGKRIVVGGTTISLFGKRGCLRKGSHDLKVWENQVADGQEETTTSGKLKEGEMARLKKLVKRYRNGAVQECEWMDKMVFRDIELVNEREKRDSDCMYLLINFPTFKKDNTEYRVVYYQTDIEPIVIPMMEHKDIKMIVDPESHNENLVENKYHRLTFNPNRKGARKNIEPPPKHKTALQKILNHPPLHPLSGKEKQAVWMYRYYLSQDGPSLPKFIKSVSWSGTAESKTEMEDALELLHQWHPLEPSEALELLNVDYAPNRTHQAIRTYALSQLQKADNEELQFYLLQLVQAIRYDSPLSIIELMRDEEEEGQSALFIDDAKYEAPTSQIEKDLAEAMIDSATGKVSFSQSEDPGYDEVLESDTEEDNQPPSEADLLRIEGASDISSSYGSAAEEKKYTSLAGFLVDRACCSTHLTNFFYWYLTTECEDKDGEPSVTQRYMAIRRKLLTNLLVSAKPKWRARYKMLERQYAFVLRLVDLANKVAACSGDREKKVDYLKKLLSADEWQHFSAQVRLPLDPSIIITGVDTDWTVIFKSVLYPMGLAFRTSTGKRYKMMFKRLDDLRKDQFVLQLLALMDRILKKEELDLKLSPYKVLACSKLYGMIEFVEGTSTVSDILSRHKSIQTFFKSAPGGSLQNGDVAPHVLDNYVRSCAGYCVITYLLSVGDRHFDNLLLTTSGKLLHIDFSYIMGRDPKPFPPPMKLSKEMVEAMGGLSSTEYQSFRKYCYITFQALRRSAHLLLNLFALMIHSSIAEIAMEQEKSVQKIRDKFRLEVTEEEAIKTLQSSIDDSVNAIFVVWNERAHKIAQYFRK